MFRLLVLSLLTSPLFSAAQTLVSESGGQQTAQGFIRNFVLFLNGTIVPFLLGIAFLIFVINVVRFFIFQSNNEDGQKAAKALATYSILAFVFILIFWGVVNLLVNTLTGCSTLNRAFDGEFGGPCNQQPVSDYINQTQTQPSGSAPNQTRSGNQPTTNTNTPNRNQRPSTPTFTPPSNEPVQPPPISDDLEGAPDPLEDPFLQGGPAQVDIAP